MSEADFSYADIRGTDFLDADLRGAKFAGARCGLAPVSLLAQKLVSLCLGALQGFIVNITLLSTWISPHVISNGAIQSIWLGTFIFLALGGAWSLWGIVQDGFGESLDRIRISIFIGLLIPMASAASTVLVAGDPGSTHKILAAIFAFFIFSSTTLANSIPSTSGALIGNFISLGIAGKTHLPGLAISLSAAFLMLVFYASYRQEVADLKSLSNSQLIETYRRATRLKLLTCQCCTRFSGADLRGASFAGAQINQVNFKPSLEKKTRLEHVNWQGASGLQFSLLRGSIAAYPRVQYLLVNSTGKRAMLRGLNLCGAYLSNADLRCADMREVNLCNAILTGANLEGANLKASQCLGTDFTGACLSGATLEGWNIDHATKLEGVACEYVYMLEKFDEQGNRRDNCHRERLPHDPGKKFEKGDFEVYFKLVIEEVKLLIKNGVDAKAFQEAFEEVMHRYPQITAKSISGIKLIGNDILATLKVPSGIDKGGVERSFSEKYNSVLIENAHLLGVLEGERRVAEVERQRAKENRNQVTQLTEVIAYLAMPTQPAALYPTVMNNTTNINAGNSSLINTGEFQPHGSIMNLGYLSDQARLAINALPDQESVEDKSTLRDLLQQLQASLDEDTSLPGSIRADVLGELHALATSAREPQKHANPARRALNALRGISKTLEESNKAVEQTSKFVDTLKTLLPWISGFFM